HRLRAHRPRPEGPGDGVAQRRAGHDNGGERGRRPRGAQLVSLLGRAVDIQVPASSANLGVGFDCLALALDLHLAVSVRVIDGPESTLAVEGEGNARLALDESNRFMAGFRAGWSDVGAAPPIAINMTNQLPLGRGLGSSAAATVAGLLAAQELAATDYDDDRLIAMAAKVEGHPAHAP